jgi:hypothetical protein
MSPLATKLLELAGSIKDAVVTVTFDFLNNVWTESEYRHICPTTHDALSEHM